MSCCPNEKPATIAARAALETDPVHGAVMPPLYLSSNYTFDGFKGKRKYDYTRSGNPTRDAVGDAIAKLEGGIGSVMTTTGMAALDLLFHLLEPGDLVFVDHPKYYDKCINSDASFIIINKEHIRFLLKVL